LSHWKSEPSALPKAPEPRIERIALMLIYWLLSERASAREQAEQEREREVVAGGHHCER
jgi:hypothetical protein